MKTDFININAVAVDNLSSCKPRELVSLKLRQTVHLMLIAKFPSAIADYLPAVVLQPAGPFRMNANDYRSETVLRYGDSYSLKFNQKPDYFIEHDGDFSKNGLVLITHADGASTVHLRVKVEDGASSGVSYYNFQDGTLNSEPSGRRIALASWSIWLPESSPAIFTFTAT